MKLNLVTIIGLLLAVAGILFLLGVGIPGSETISAGPVSASVPTERQIHPAISGALLAIGLVAIVSGQKKT